MTNRRIVIAGTGSGTGKTTITLGLLSALMKKGFRVQGFKCGPDYIDPTYHTAVTKRVSRNLDSWMFDHNTLKEVFLNASSDADISVIEGVMGLYDGKDPRNNIGSTAEISTLLQAPVLLVVNVQSMARSAAAIVKGYQMLDESVNIVGVIVNKVGSKGHNEIVKTAIEQECHVPVFGYLERNLEIELPERHLGLIPSVERGDLNSFFNTLGEAILETVDVDKIIKASEANELTSQQSSIFEKKEKNGIRIAIAKDAAFHFYYQENIEILESFGAECVYFSPLKDEVVPENVHGIYIGGGFPEEFAPILANNEKTKASIKKEIENGIPVLAECGGFMYLTEKIITNNQLEYEMLGLIGGHIQMQEKLAALGYRTIEGHRNNFLFSDEVQAKGHEFHYSTYHPNKNYEPAYFITGRKEKVEDGVLYKNVSAGYTHIHFASCPKIAENWIEKCMEWRDHE